MITKAPFASLVTVGILIVAMYYIYGTIYGAQIDTMAERINGLTFTIDSQARFLAEERLRNERLQQEIKQLSSKQP